MRKFKRSVNGVVMGILVGVMIILFMLFFGVRVVTGNIYDSEITFIEWLTFIPLVIVMILLPIAFIAIPPDFDYVVRTEEDYIIFEISKEDHRVLKRSFTIIEERRNQIILYDGVSRIPIAYDQKLRKFLDEIKT